MVGVLAVGPTTWHCELHSASGKKWTQTLTKGSPDHLRTYDSGAQKRSRYPGCKKADVKWRKGEKGQEANRRHNQTLRDQAKRKRCKS